jgi:hypothetical protein
MDEESRRVMLASMESFKLTRSGSVWLVLGPYEYWFNCSYSLYLYTAQRRGVDKIFPIKGI